MYAHGIVMTGFNIVFESEKYRNVIHMKLCVSRLKRCISDLFYLKAQTCIILLIILHVQFVIKSVKHREQNTYNDDIVT